MEKQRLKEEKKRQEEIRQKKAKEEIARKKEAVRESNIKLLIENATALKASHSDRGINVRDFVVRRNVFRCLRDNHTLKNIAALVAIIDRDGEFTETTIPSGYCVECNLYYILNGTYLKLRREGLLCCRIFSEQSLSSVNSNGFSSLSETSILMDYGYSVSAQKDIPAIQRQKLLSVLMEKNIISKSGILSYIDFFISNLGKGSNMDEAVSKWKEDREFVESYDIINHEKVIVHSLYHRR